MLNFENKKNTKLPPLSYRVRPKNIKDFVGQNELFQSNSLLNLILNKNHLVSLVLQGPSGTGKTTLAHLIAAHYDGHFKELSAVTDGVKQLKEIVALSTTLSDKPFILFIDEIHRFSKSQQDFLLPFIESGQFYLIAATTENISFELNNALLSRLQVLKLKSLEATDITKRLKAVIEDPKKGLSAPNPHITTKVDHKVIHSIAELSNGDLRYALNMLETCYYAALQESDKDIYIKLSHLKSISSKPLNFDKKNNNWYDQISALQKSIRGSDPDAALYWAAKMIESGCPYDYVFRRLLVIASEDVGLAEPNCITIINSCWEAYKKLGDAETDSFAQAIVYLACCPKSNSIHKAWKKVRKDIQNGPDLGVPEHLKNTLPKNATIKYRYSHDEPYAYSPGQIYFPSSMEAKTYYEPKEYGFEKKLQNKLEFLKKLTKN
ncbi:replication-associated recombination protein A [Paraphotobacterium marinum]